MEWFTLGLQYGLVGLGIIVTFIAAFSAIAFIFGLVSSIVGRFAGDDEDEGE